MKYSLILCIVLAVCGAPHLEAQRTGGNNAAQAAALFEQGMLHMANEQWYSAVESFIECINLNSAHAEGTAALAECYFMLGEYDEALTWVRRARVLSRTNTAVANLEAFILIALGQLDSAAEVISGVLGREPYNREALFAAGELDIARGRSAEALLRYRDAVRRFPDDRRLLVSLALVSGSLGDNEAALSFINRALSHHPDDHRVYFYAAYTNAQAGNLDRAITLSQQALVRRPGYRPALSLLANLRYRIGEFNEASDLADQLIAQDRRDMGAWYLKGLSFIRLGRNIEAITILSNALAIDPGNEFIRAVLEDTLIAATTLEDPRRARWAAWHFDRARDFNSRNLIEQSLFQYRRGLRLNPYASDRREYAELLRLQGYPARYLEELRFMQEQGLGDRSLNDAVEGFSSLLSNALFVRWGVNPIDLNGRHWNIAVFSIAGQSSYYHVDAGVVCASVIREILVHDRSVTPMDLELRQGSFAQAFRTARESNADYFLIISTMENERDISIKGELFVGRTGAPAGSFTTYRTGVDRLRNASRGIVDQLTASLPLRGRLVIRQQNQGLIDKGRADGVNVGDVFDIVNIGRSQVANRDIGLIYTDDDIVGTITIEHVDEEVSTGLLTRSGFFDRIEEGDEIISRTSGRNTAPAETAANPELRVILRTLRD